MRIKPLLWASAVCLLGACTSENGEDLAGGNALPTPACDTTPVTYALTVAPLLQQRCTRCHAGALPAGGVALGTYAQAKAIAADGRLLGTVNHDPGYPPMPQGAPQLAACDLAQLRAWVAAGAPNN